MRFFHSVESMEQVTFWLNTEAKANLHSDLVVSCLDLSSDELICKEEMSPENQIVIIYDRQCHFCQSSVEWVEQKLSVVAKPFQQTNLGEFGLTHDQCSKSVQVIADAHTYSGATAIYYLLKCRGNRGLSTLITTSGPVGHWGYRWISTHRSSKVVTAMTVLLEKSNLKYRGREGI